MPHGMWGIAFSKTFPVLGPRNGNILFINLFDAGNRHLRMGLAGKDICICLSGTPCFYQIPFQKDSAGACDYDPAGFIPFSSDCQFIQIFFLKEIPDFEVADFLCPCPAGIHQVQKNLVTESKAFFRVWEPEQDGHFAKGKDSPRLNGFLFYRHPPDRIGKHSRRFKVPVLCISGKRSKR